MVDFNDRRRVDPNPTKGTISHAKARDIASRYEDNNLRPLATEGRVHEEVIRAVDEKLPDAHTKKEARELSQLRRYAEKNVGRGPVRDWTNLER
jgi:hypothetical protein